MTGSGRSQPRAAFVFFSAAGLLLLMAVILPRVASPQYRGEVAVDSMVITRSGSERVVRYGFELARKRGRKPMKVTCVDKANVFRSMAFFRRVYDEVAAGCDAGAVGEIVTDAALDGPIREIDVIGVVVEELDPL